MLKNPTIQKFAINFAMDKVPTYLWENIHWGQVWFWTLFSLVALGLLHYPHHPVGRWRRKHQNDINLFTGSPIYSIFTLIFTFASNFVLFTALSALSHSHGADLGLKIGAGLAGLLIVGALVPLALWTRHNFRLIIIDALYFLIFLSWAGKVMGGR
ncbi:MAG: hypothetical protein GX801_05090 [Fibrobacter sp.]|nr:hypothetical protein [Fibrobacter sp.]